MFDENDFLICIVLVQSDLMNILFLEMSQQHKFNEWIQRPSSAQSNLQTHPCFQSSLLDDGHAPGTVGEWRKSLSSSKPQFRMTNINRDAEDYDQNLEVKSYVQSVNQTKTHSSIDKKYFYICLFQYLF